MQLSPPNNAPYVVVMLGDTSVGKTSIISRLIDDRFNPMSSGTVGANFQQYQKLVGDRQFTLNIWDTAGQERFRALAPIYYRGAKAGIAVFSMDSRDSIESIPEQISVFLDHAKDALVFVAGNKVDIHDGPTFPKEDAMEFANQHNWRLFFTSAKTGDGVGELFAAVVDEMAKVKNEAKPRNTLDIDAEDNSCC
jgi:small GTP-binding protein